SEKREYVLDRVPPPSPEDQTADEYGEYLRHTDDNLQARCYMLASMSNELQRQNELLNNASEILLHLQELYGDRTRQIRYQISKELFRCRMTESSSVHDHGLKMIALVERLSSLGVIIDNELYATVVAQFRDYHAEKFSGQGDPRIVDESIQGLELIFEVMDCPDRYRVICAQLQLTGDARLWWNAYWSMHPGEKEGCTWDRLKELIREKYYPTYYRAEMERQFLSLKQGTRSVDKYEREFTRLAAFVPDLVRTEAQRAQRFIDELYPAVRHNIVGHGTQTYAFERRRTMIGCSQLPLPSLLQLHLCHQPLPSHRRTTRGRGKVPRWTRGPGGGYNRFHRAPHADVFTEASRLSSSSRRADIRPESTQSIRLRPSPGTMSGMIMLNNIPVFALFDTGATHSFISRRCLDAIGVHAITAVDPLEVSLASGRKIVTSARASDLSLSIGGRALSNAYVLEIRNFDLILGMDWLSFYNADIRCHDREITLYLPGDDSITFFGTRNRSLPHV
ncbi:Unknown protein, partial [Striga hermonthica]